MKKRVFSRGFVICMFLYILLFLTAACWLIISLSGLLERYEDTRPQYAVRAYMSSFDGEHINRLARDFAAGAADGLVSEPTAEEALNGLFAEGLSSAVEYTGTESLRVHVYAGGHELGYGELRRTGESIKGLKDWALTGESFDFRFLLSAFECTIPADCTLSVDGRLLGPEFISQSGIPYKCMKDLGSPDYLPTAVTYRVEEYLGTPELTVTLPDGSTRPAGTSFNEEEYLDNCSPAELERLYEYSNTFVKTYIRFAGNYGGRRISNLMDMQALSVPGSPLYELLESSKDTVYWETGRSNDLSALNLNHCRNLGGGRYYIDLEYICDTLGTRGYVSTRNCVKMIAAEIDGRLLTEIMVSY